MLEQKAADARERQEVLNEIQAKREQNRKLKDIESKEKLKELNEMKFDKIKEHEVLLKEKAFVLSLLKKNPQLLSQIEDKTAPPRQFIQRNM